MGACCTMSAKASSSKRTCLEEEELAAPGRHASKAPRRRKQSAEQVAIAIKDNCADLSAGHVDGTKVDRGTHRETLLKDPLAVKAGEWHETFGKKYHEALHGKYSSQEFPNKLLICRDEALPVNPDLFAAMASLKDTPANRCSAHCKHHLPKGLFV